MNFVPGRECPRQIRHTESTRKSGLHCACRPVLPTLVENLDVRPATPETQYRLRRPARPTSTTGIADPAETAMERRRRTDRRADQAFPKISRGMLVRIP